MKVLLKKGSAEIVAIVLLIVVIGGIALSVSGSISKQTTKSTKAGLQQNTSNFEKVYIDIQSELNN